MSLEAAINNLVSRLESVTSRLESVERQLQSGGSSSSSSSQASSSGEAPSVAVQEFEDLINQHVKPYVEIAKKIDATLGEQVDSVQILVNR